MTTPNPALPSLLLSFAALACSAPSGEESATPAPPEAVRAAEASDMAYPGDPAIEACLQLINVRTHTRDELLRAEFTLRNASTQDLEGSWTVAWAGADGLPLSVPLGWSPFNLPPGASKALSITAPEPGAASWTLHAVDGDPNRGAN